VYTIQGILLLLENDQWTETFGEEFRTEHLDFGSVALYVIPLLSEFALVSDSSDFEN
jgi:hypothetical protein